MAVSIMLYSRQQIINKSGFKNRLLSQYKIYPDIL